MHRLAPFLLLFTLPVAAQDNPAKETPVGEFRPLFDGKSLAGWVVKGEPGKEAPADQWQVKDGLLTAKPGNSWLSTQAMYGDFVLRLEWRVPENGNSGVFLRVPDLKPGEQPHVRGVEIQVLDDKGSQYAGKLKEWQYAGSIYGAVAAKDSGYKGAGEWNRFEITCRGDKIAIVMNDRPVAEANMAESADLKSRPRRGYLGLQNHGTPVEYRKIEIKVLD